MPHAVSVTLRRLRSLVAALVLVAAAGPASAVCAHAPADDAHGPVETHGDAGHAPAEAPPPCHGGPAAPADEAPAPHDDVPPCASACCAGPAVLADEVALGPVAPDSVLPTPVVAVVAAPVEAPAPTPAVPPPPPLRVHVALQRFLI